MTSVLPAMTDEEALEVLKDDYDSLLVGVFVDGRCVLNPPGGAPLGVDTELLVVRDRPVDAAPPRLRWP